MVELDEKRAQQLRSAFLQPNVPALPRGLSGLLGSFQEQLSNNFMGGDLKAAISEAERLNIPIVYGDLSSEETLSGVMKGLGQINPMKMMMEMQTNAGDLMGDLGEGPIVGKKMKNAVEYVKHRLRVRKLRNFMLRAAPSVAEPLLRKREAHMWSVLKKLADVPGTNYVVAVTGIGHLDGIEEEWRKTVEVNAAPPGSIIHL